jgi:hypothetical protein
MLDRSQQLGIGSHQPCQRLRVETIIFPTAGTDQLHLPGIGRDNFMAQGLQYPTHPRRMRANFQGDATAAHRTKHLGIAFLFVPTLPS